MLNSFDHLSVQPLSIYTKPAVKVVSFLYPYDKKGYYFVCECLLVRGDEKEIYLRRLRRDRPSEWINKTFLIDKP